MDSLNWYLNKLLPNQGDAFKTLDEWFNPELNPFMDRYYQEGVRHHPKNVNQFTRGDYRDNQTRPPGQAVWWRRQMARRLFGLRMAINQHATQIDRHVKAVYSPEYRLRNHFWLLRNCHPYCGDWEADNRFLYRPGNPTGYPCESRLCPWCWMRRFDTYVKACRCPLGHVMRTRRRKFHGLGFQGLVNVTSFDYTVGTTDPDDPFFNEPFAFYTPRAMKSFDQIRMGPPDRYLLRLLTLLYREHTEQGRTIPQVGIRVGFLHTDRIHSNLQARMPGLHTFNQVTVEDAIRWTYPYPIGWLESDEFVKVKLRLLGCFHGLTHHGITTIKIPPTRNLSCQNIKSTAM